jgi:CCR4-NOT complex subunit CAF16
MSAPELAAAVEPAVAVDRLTFAYPDGTPVFRDLSLVIPAGARCLLLGANGVGKSTLLRILAGRHLVPAHAVRVLGRAAFHDTTLAGDVAFVGGPFAFAVDITVREILERRSGVDPRRRAAMLEMLDVDPGWRMHRVSDGQRRRVQLLLDLERRLRLVLLDEVTAELDVLARADLLRFLRAESEQDGLTVIYASHVLDGLRSFGTHLAFLSPGRLRRLAPLDEIAELAPPLDGAGGAGGGGAPSPLHALCERWMNEDRQQAVRR